MRRHVFACHMASMPETPCGCQVTLATCECHEDSCFCPAEVTFCEHAADWGPEFIGQYLAAVGDLLARLDPGFYAEPPLPTHPILTPSREDRMAMYAARAEKGVALFHPDPNFDCKPERRKCGVVMTTQRNGVVSYGGTKAAPDTTTKARWRGRVARTSGRMPERSMGVEDLITASEG